jgi:succinate dehydrogenase hydrophobic anchor subunit
LIAVLLKFSSYAKQRQIWHMTSYALAGGIPAALLLGGPVATVVDVALGVALPLHFHMGMRSVIIDYLSPKPDIQRIALAILAGVTALSAIGLAKFNFTDVGLTGGVKELLYEQEQPSAVDQHNKKVLDAAKKHHH